MPKERWKWAFASVRASAEKYSSRERLVLVDRADWRPAEESTLADRKGPTGCAPHTDTDTPVGARLT